MAWPWARVSRAGPSASPERYATKVRINGGWAMEEMTLRVDSQPRTISLGETRDREEVSRMKDAIIEFL